MKKVGIVAGIIILAMVNILFLASCQSKPYETEIEVVFSDTDQVFIKDSGLSLSYTGTPKIFEYKVKIKGKNSYIDNATAIVSIYSFAAEDYIKDFPREKGEYSISILYHGLNGEYKPSDITIGLHIT